MKSMQSRVFRDGNHIWECKSSPSDNGGSIELASLLPEINNIKKRWAKEGAPSGYNYVFPANLISNKTREELEKFKGEYEGRVEVGYYDCEQVQKLIQGLLKLGTMQSLVDYIKQAQKR